MSARPELTRPQFALLLLRSEGIGRVTANRILRQFRDLTDLRRYPRDQLLARLSGLPKADKTIDLLFDDEHLNALLESVDAELADCRRRRVVVSVTDDEAYPARLTPLQDAERPSVVYLFGATPETRSKSVAVFGQPPLEPTYFEDVQRIVADLASTGSVTVLAAKSGFDVAIVKRATGAGGRVVMVAESGLNHIPREIRPAVSLAVKSGGTILTPYPFDHGPFAHDAGQRAFLMAALSDAVLICDEKPADFVVEAAQWALANQRSVFSFAAENGVEGAHVLRDGDDEEWLRSAVMRT